MLCGEILGRPLHHTPSRGGEAEDKRHRTQYEATLRRYEEAFGEPPPRSVWPRSTAPAAPKPAREADGDTLPLFRWLLAVMAGSAAALAFGLPGMIIVAILAVLALAIAAATSRRPRGRGAGGCSGGGGCDGYVSRAGDDGTGSGASCGGGCGGD